MKSLLEKMLDSLVRFSSDVNYELIVIDNNSQDGTSEMIKSNYPTAVLITNDENRGVAAARNQGLKIAKGKYILILDADMEFKENSIKMMYDEMEKNPDYGLMGCKLIDTAGEVQYSCKRFPKLRSLIYRRLEFIEIIKNSRALKEHIMAEWDHNDIKDVDYVIGACQFFRRELINKIGLYDDSIFYGPEDLDYCLRVWRAGYKVIYFPHTSIIHHEQRITKKNLFSSISRKHLKAIFYIFKKYNFSLTRKPSK